MSDPIHDAGMTVRREVLMHTAVYAGVPAANAAFAIAQRVLTDEGVIDGPSA